MRVFGKRNRRKERGTILVLSLVVLFMVAGFSFALLSVSTGSQQVSKINAKRLTARSLAESAVEIGKNWCQTQWANQQGSLVEAKALANTNLLNDPGNWAPCTISGQPARWALVRVTADLNPTPNATSPVQYVSGTNGWAIDGTDGVRTFHYTYALYGRADSAVKSGAGDAGTVTAQACQVFETLVTPLFQYCVFYNTDLEILPGPNMKLTGRVHSNRDMYLGCGATMTMDTDYVRAVGKMYRWRKDDLTASPGVVLIKNLANLSDAITTNDFETKLPNGTTTAAKMFSKTELAALGIATPNGFDSSFGGFDQNSNGTITDSLDWKPWGAQAMAFWGGTVQTSDMNVPLAQPPQQSLTIDPFVATTGGDFNKDAFGNYTQVPTGTGAYKKGTMHSSAGIVVRNGKVYTKDGTDISSIILPNTITMSSIYDAREKKNIPQIKIDVGLLKASLEQPGTSTNLIKLKNSWNGLVYASQDTASAAVPYGVLLTNGAELPNNPLTNAQTGLTVATNLPVYIHGDYNTTVNGVSSGALNLPTTRKPASVIGDAVNLLSNAWNNSKTSGSGLPKGTSTIFNTAMIAGNTETSVGTYNGGLENLPRFHEDWTNRTCTIAGSFVNLWSSKIAKGKWVYGSNVYTAPNRVWDFDSNYKEYVKIPPFTPMVVQVKEIVTQD